MTRSRTTRLACLGIREALLGWEPSLHATISPSDRDRWLTCDDRKLLGECDVHTYRASGPGGQKRNKTDSAVRLHHRPTELTVVATESRSQHENRARALRRLRLAIALTVREPVDAESSDWADVLAGCIGPDRRLRVNRKNPLYVGVVASLLDALHAYRGRVTDAAQAVGTTTTQLTRFLAADKKLLAAANQLRAMHGHRPLRT